MSKIDFGLLVASGPFEIGLHASAGSARKRADRVFGAMARREWALLYLPVPFLISTGVEYEADGGLDMQKGLAVAELTPIGAGRVGLGRFTRHVTRNRIAPDGQAVTRRIPTGIRWRPWIGVGYGHVFKIDAAPTREDSSAFFRGYGRLVAALRVPVGDWLVEGALEGTAWYVGGFNGDNFAHGSLSLLVGGTVIALTASADVGRQPPRFSHVGGISLGIGFRYPDPKLP